MLQFANPRRNQNLNLIGKKWLALLITSGVVASSSCVVMAADRSPEVEAAIQKGADYLSKVAKDAENGLLPYALMASGRAPTDPEVARLLAKIVAKTVNMEYVGKGEHIYEAGVDAMALASADKEKYRPQLEAIANYLIAQQRDDGSWDYPNQRNGGDTSISQYAMLGLWAAARAGVPIPLRVWDRAAGWHFRTQNPEGSFGYHPFGGTKGGSHSMTVAGVGSLCIAKIYLSESPQPAAEREPEDESTGKSKKPEKAFGVLEKAAPMEIADPAEPKPVKSQDDKNYRPTSSKRDLDGHIGRGLGWLGGKATYTIEKPIGWSKYYLYGLERASALSRSEKLGGHDWYKEGCQHLIATQSADGAWLNDPGGPHATTAFAVLFLCRATDKIAPNSPPAKKGVPTFGGGLLQGGRGLPTELSAVETKDGQITAKKLDTPLDKLLADLESPQAKNVEATQDSIVQAVQVGDRQTLIGKKDLLLRLTRDKRVDVRRTAYWGLGRCNDLRISPILIQGLLDPDFDVAVEARNALCVLSRRPRGFGLPDDLIATLPENAGQVEKDTAFEKWRREDHQKWKQWYQSVRPYAERDQLAD